MQECWELMYDTVDTVYDCVRIATGVLSTIKTRPDRMLKGVVLWLRLKNDGSSISNRQIVDGPEAAPLAERNGYHCWGLALLL